MNLINKSNNEKEVKEKEAELNICLWSKKIVLDLTEEPSETTSEEQNETSSED
jgi:hypothetical protein